jgi:spore coat polysaccharide biosynthesis protein SpsF (cytidylyltransferase family)
MLEAAAIICSRVKSSRLPEKAIKKICGLTPIEHILNRLDKIGMPAIIATPPEDVKYFIHFEKRGVRVTASYPKSPLHRMADIYNLPKWIIRITHDDIIIDPDTIQQLIKACEAEGAGYGITPSIIEGAGVEVIRKENLIAAAKMRKEPTEFVSYFVRGEGLPYPKIVKLQPRPSIARPYRLTMDYPEDALLLEILMRALGVDAKVDDICAYLDQRPYLLHINKMPEISFYTCIYNMDRYIEKTIKSVMDCSGIEGIDNFEYIIVDDFSKDNSVDKVARYLSDKRLRLILNDKNKGLASSSNIALSAIRGKYVMRVDADDYLIPGRIRKLLDCAKSFGIQALYPMYNEFNNDGKVIREGCNPRDKNHPGCALFEKRLLDELRFKDGIRRFDGQELFDRIKDRAKIDYFDTPTWLYRKHKLSLSANDK